MSLNKKSFIFAIVVMALALFGIYFASRTVLLQGYKDLEKKQLERNVSRSIFSLQNVSAEIATLNNDWAHWDDAYDFVQDKNSEFINVNFDDNTFESTKLNAIVFVDNEGSLVYGKMYDFASKKETPILDSLKTHLNRSDQLITHIGRTNVFGIVNLPEGLLFVASTPVLRSDGSGPSKGTLIMGRFINQKTLDDIKNITQFPVEIIDTSESPFAGKTEDVDFITSEIQKDIVGFGKIKDIYGKDAGVVKINMVREVVDQGENILSYFLLIVFLMGSIVVTGAVYFQERYVLAPIFKLSEDVKRIRSKGNLSERVDVIGKDEISRLANDVNAMLTSLQDFNAKSKENELRLAEKLSLIEKQNKDLQNSKLAMMNILEDEKELDKTLQKEHDRLDLILNSMGEGLLVIDKNFKITSLNPAAERLLEVKSSEAIGKKWSDLATTLKKTSVTPTDERSFSKAIIEGKTTITDISDLHNYKTVSGRIFPIVSVTAPLEVDGKIIGAVKVFKDATKERQSREVIEKEVVDRTKDLWAERARMFASINSLHMGFLIADVDQNVVVKNPAMSELLKINDKDITLPVLASEFKANFDLMAACKECVEKSTSFGRDDIYYKDKFLRIFLTPVQIKNETEDGVNKDNRSKTIGFVLLVEDVTSEKQLARSKDEFFAVASHELRTPLTAIRGNTSLIMDYYAEKIQDKDLKEMISDMHESSIRLINIVNDFLDASRLEQGKVDFKPEEFNIVEVMQGAVKELADFAGQKGLTFNIDDKDRDIKVFADKARTQQIATNLLGNALKFTKSGEINVNFDKVGKNIKISVSDLGAGISPANQRLLFKKFQQAGEKVLARDVSKGTGMGLYISKLLAEGMDGKIYLDKSELGAGSTFAFELPVKK